MREIGRPAESDQISSPDRPLATANPGESELNQSEGMAKAQSVVLIALLFLTSVLCWYDRSLLSILLQPIESDIGFSDLQAGLLTGFAFNLLVLVAVVPVARLADRGSHMAVLISALVGWSAATSLCGVVGSFKMLFVSRMLVGLGEAGSAPATHALVSTTLPQNLRGRALSVVGLGTGIGVLSAGWIGGSLAQEFGWRATFIGAGLAGLVVTMALLVIRGMPSMHSVRPSARPTNHLSTAQGVRILLRRRSFRWLLGAIALVSIGYYAIQGWMPTFLIRAFGLTTAQAGTYYSMCSVAPMLVGMLVGGAIGDRYVEREPRTAIWLLIASYGGSAIFLLAFYQARDLHNALALLAIGSLMIGLYVGPFNSLIQSLAELHLRATASALTVLTTGIFGASVGPALIGFLNGLNGGGVEGDAIRASMSYSLIAPVLSVIPAYVAARHLLSDLNQVESTV